MLLSNLIASSKGLKLSGSDISITGLATDSRKVKPGQLYIAIPGTNFDGRDYIKDAFANGAVAVMLPEGSSTSLVNSTITSSDVRRAVPNLAAVFYARQPQTIAAVTGTSGKTSTVQFVRELWNILGYKSASIGTLGLITSKETRYGSLTTPDPITLHQMLDECATDGITHLAMEASSHGLDLHRLDAVKVQVAGFTNLSRDHLDYHLTMEKYLAAKMRLFTDIVLDGGTAVLNSDIPEFPALLDCAQKRQLKVISYGRKSNDIKLIDIKADLRGQLINLSVHGREYNILLPVMGAFQVCNALCALGIIISSGENATKTVRAMERLSGVPGRMQLAGYSTTDGAVFIDYAHKPDALESVLQTMRPHVAAQSGAKLGVIFGCGGNRDKGKRPIMGEIAQRLADWVIVTDDNPRHEEPATIRQEILMGCKAGTDIQDIGDRYEAITSGIAKLHAGDVLIIAGKGHEIGQIVGDTVMPFDDLAVARKVLQS
jgi:UDP-N-acetylmuramoyl-L-alanyl-D-glutamate--2,6-diaminopimelate ligase